MNSSGPTIPNLEFTKISSNVLLYTPPLLKKTNPTDPTTILFCPWMGASLRSRALNAAFHKHHELYPNARIILVRSSPDWFTTTTQSARQKLMTPALAAIEADPAGSNKKILAHVFSNGGGLAYLEICTLYKERHQRILLTKALVNDSYPLRDITARQAWNAMKVGLPKGAAWYPSALFMWLFISAYWSWLYIFQQKILTDYIREGLLNFEVMNRDAKRLYAYGVRDEMIGWKGVETEIGRAREAGVDVVALRDEVNPHVQYMIKDEERYWSAIKELWDRTR